MRTGGFRAVGPAALDGNGRDARRQGGGRGEGGARLETGPRGAERVRAGIRVGVGAAQRPARPGREEDAEARGAADGVV